MLLLSTLCLLACEGGGESDSGTIPDSGGTTDSSSPSGCTQTHARVGQTASLVTRHHDTAGTATILDDCTIGLTGFNYDGTGLDVRFYGALDEDYSSGFPLSEDLRLVDGYDNATLTLAVPGNHSLDEVDSLSLWCVDVGVSFGDGVFEGP